MVEGYIRWLWSGHWRTIGLGTLLQQGNEPKSVILWWILQIHLSLQPWSWILWPWCNSYLLVCILYLFCNWYFISFCVLTHKSALFLSKECCFSIKITTILAHVTEILWEATRTMLFSECTHIDTLSWKEFFMRNFFVMTMIIAYVWVPLICNRNDAFLGVFVAGTSTMEL